MTDQAAVSSGLPDDYESAPWPTIEIVAREGFGGETVRLRFEQHAKRNVPNHNDETATNWVATLAWTGTDIEYHFEDAFGDDHTFAAPVGTVLALGYKRNDDDRDKEFYVVRDDVLESLGSGMQGRVETMRLLRDREASA